MPISTLLVAGFLSLLIMTHNRPDYSNLPSMQPLEVKPVLIRMFPLPFRP